METLRNVYITQTNNSVQMASGRNKNKGKWYHKSAIVIYKGPLGARTNELPLSNTKQTMVQNSYFSKKCLFTQSKDGTSNEAKS